MFSCHPFVFVDPYNKCDTTVIVVINYGDGRGGGAKTWENCGSETFCAPPPPTKKG